MSEARPFIPRDKPRFWVLFVLACLSGIGVGLIAFAAAWFDFRWLALPMIFVFFVCWLVAAISFFGVLFGAISGRYRNLTSRPWAEQVW
jgi:hypothetical protein